MVMVETNDCKLTNQFQLTFSIMFLCSACLSISIAYPGIHGKPPSIHVRPAHIIRIPYIEHHNNFFIMLSHFSKRKNALPPCC